MLIIIIRHTSTYATHNNTSIAFTLNRVSGDRHWYDKNDPLVGTQIVYPLTRHDEPRLLLSVDYANII